MLRLDFPAWVAAFSYAGEGDLRVSDRAEAAEPLALVQERALAALGVAGAAVAHQVHGSSVVTVEEPLRGYLVGVGEGDGVATTRAGLAAAVHVADCVPVAVGGRGGVAMLHCGWRGLAGGIIAAGVGALRSLGVAGDLQAAIGPGAGGCCYETGDELRAIFAAYGASEGRLLDLKAVAASQLRQAGVAEVRDVGVCTICAADGVLFSHRREGPATGRQGGFAWLR
jgi:purine-nucleoside/S-methyl-5'-thioadenosine phosphorylase / adenosine deaminase